MKSQDGLNSRKNEDFWDVLILRREGQWIGFRAPWRSLTKSASYLSFLFVLTALGLSGWLLSRWQVHRLTRELSASALQKNSLDREIERLKAATPGALSSTPEALSFLPSLEADEINTGILELQNLQVELLAKSGEIRIQFEARRSLQVNLKEKFYWILFLHGPPGLLSYPASLTSRKGDIVLYQRGQVLEDLSTKRLVNATFRVPQTFIEAAGPEPLYASVMIYDARGTLTHRKRQEISGR